MTWIDPIYDRTQADARRVEGLNNIISANGFAALTPSEQTEWSAGLKGALKAADLNRIEGNTQHLSALLYAYGYGMAGLTHNTDWDMTDLPMVSHLERIRCNIQHMIDIYHAQAAQLPEDLSSPDWRDINAVERILYEMADMIQRMELSFKICGAATCGASFEL